MCQIVETVLGTDWEINTYPVDGWQITVTNSDTRETLYNKRVIADSLYEAVTTVCWDVWDNEIHETKDHHLPGRIANALGVYESQEAVD